MKGARLWAWVARYGPLLWSLAYALLQLGMSLRHGSYWFGSLAVYYAILTALRWMLLRRRGRDSRLRQLRTYRACGAVLLAMTLALALMIFFMVYWNRTFRHHEITTIALATYTFTTLTLAIIQAVSARRRRSPLPAAAAAIQLAAACVSVLTLETTMLTTFGEGTVTLAARRWMLGTSGGAIAAGILTMAVYMLVHGTAMIQEEQRYER